MSTQRTAKPNTIGRHGKFRLAAACAELMSDDDMAWWLREVMAGRDPDAVRDTDGNVRNGGASAPDWATRIKAAVMFLERRSGRAPQQIVIEQEQAAAAAAARQVMTPSAVAALDPAKRDQLRALLREAVGKPGAPRPQPSRAEPVVRSTVIDTTAVEAESE